MESISSSSSAVKLSQTNYSEWRQQMLDLFERRQLVGFVDGTIQQPEKEQNKEDYLSWKKSDSEVRRLIFEMVTEEILKPLAQVVPLETARDVWIASEEMLSRSAPTLPESISEPGFPLEANPTTRIMASPLSRTFSSSTTVKLCRTNYSEWRQQMLDILKSNELVGYVDGTIPQLEEEIDVAVRDWIFDMVEVEILESLPKVPSATAREAWIALEEMLSPSASSLPQSIAEFGEARGFPTATSPAKQIMASTSSSSSTVMLHRTNYSEWRQQILESLKENQVVGFVDGTIQAPEEAQNQVAYLSWKTSDDQVREWILERVTVEVREPLEKVRSATAREVWIALPEMLCYAAPSQPQCIHGPGAARGFPTETNPTKQIMASPLSRASSSSSAGAGYYPYPSGVNAADFISLRLSPTNYSEWKQLMFNFIECHQLVGFIDGTIQPPEEEQNPEEYRSWRRSDIIVRAWIIVTVTAEILPLVMRLQTAREVWIALEEMLGSSASSLPQSISEPERAYEERARMVSRYSPLYKAILNDDWETASIFLLQEPDGIRNAITLKSETALMVAVRSSERNHIVKKLIEVMSEEEVAQRDITGQTALYKAVEIGNNEAAMLLVAKNRELPNILNLDEGIFPVHLAALAGNREMVLYLLEATTVEPNTFEGPLGLNLLIYLTYGGLYDIASTFLQKHPILASMKPSPLLVMVHMHDSFRSGTHLNFFESLIYSCIPLVLEGDGNSPLGRDIENSMEGAGSVLVSRRLNATFWDVAEKLVPPIKSVRETKQIHNQALKFVEDLCNVVVRSDYLSRARGVLGPVMSQAASLGTCEIVEEILEAFCSGIHLYNDKMQNFIHVAIENRQEDVFNIIYQLGENQQRYFLSQIDESGNSPLHMAGNLAPMQQLSLRASVDCPALQMQRELQWFKAIEKLVPPKIKYTRNVEQRIPQELFTETHKDLVKEGEKWMKDTASSCTIVAVLIITVVFAAAIIVPGGSDSDSGLPIFLEDRAFVLFGVFDALALFSSTTSLLMFLSILTSRYGEQDFLYSLPKKLIMGLFTLFLSIIAMMAAFAVTLKIVFGHNRTWITISGVALSCVPIALFVLLQFPLLVGMIKSTYFPRILRKRSKLTFY